MAVTEKGASDMRFLSPAAAGHACLVEQALSVVVVHALMRAEASRPATPDHPRDHHDASPKMLSESARASSSSASSRRVSAPLAERLPFGSRHSAQRGHCRISA